MRDGMQPYPEKQLKALRQTRITRTDTNGSTATAIYKATVTAVTPTGTNITSTGKQGRPQTGKPTFRVTQMYHWIMTLQRLLMMEANARKFQMSNLPLK